MLQLQLGEGQPVRVQIRKQTFEQSAHTGRQLQQLHAWASTADSSVHDEISAALAQLGEKPVRALDEDGEHAGRWCISWNSYGESAGIHTYTLLLREVEDLSLDALLVGDIELRPYEYREMVVRDGLTLRAKMAGTHEDVLRIRALLREHSTFSVVRRGIDETPREMKVGLAEWSEAEDRIRYRLILVDKSLNEAGNPELARIEEENRRAALAYYANFLDGLAELMIERDIVSRADLARLRDAAYLASDISRNDLWKVADVDEL